MVIAPFSIAPLPQVTFGAGSVARLPGLLASFGRRLLLVTGARSLRASRQWGPLEDALAENKLAWLTVTVEGEPSPELVDEAVREHHGGRIDAVVGIGGGSVLDAAKAIAGLLQSGRSVMDHLEDVGRGVPFTGPTTPLVAVPTTAGTGSEATKNAVLSKVGEGGFKKSFRHDVLIARHAVIDPDLLATCPRERIAADGMDALTQLLEAYVSARASVFTDAVAESGLAAARDGLLAWYEGGGDAPEARARMAYAALVSGIVLAQAGLGAVHGLASPLGAFHAAPHGAACGTLLAAATRANLVALREREPASTARAKYARAWSILSGNSQAADDDEAGTRLVELLEAWTRRLDLPRLSTWGIGEGDVARLVAASRGSSMKTNPVVLTDGEIEAIVRARL